MDKNRVGGIGEGKAADFEGRRAWATAPPDLTDHHQLSDEDEGCGLRSKSEGGSLFFLSSDGSAFLAKLPRYIPGIFLHVYSIFHGTKRVLFFRKNFDSFLFANKRV
jgi:hypothetical protein